MRMVLSDKAAFPGSYIHGKEIRRGSRQAAGLLIMDDEGSELGGLIYGGAKDKSGKIEANAHLSFDQYMQDQIFTIDAGRNGDQRWSALSMSDRGDYPITEALAAEARIGKLPQEQQDAAWDEFYATHPGNNTRVVLGRARDKGSVLRLKDVEGRDRIVLRVAPDGQPSLDLLDERGTVVSHLPEKSPTASSPR